jgi:hypothetical protein
MDAGADVARSVKPWRKAMRSVVIDRIGEFPLETNESVPDLLLANYDVMDGLDFRTATDYVADIRNGRKGFGRKTTKAKPATNTV